MPPRIAALLKPIGIAVAFLALVPFAFIAKARVTTSNEPRIHIIADMDNQASFRKQEANPLFADGRAMRPPVPGTVARGEAELDDHLYRGLAPDGASFADAFPASITVDRAFLERGQQRYTIHCAVCHGHSGYGDGVVQRRAVELVSKGLPGMEWVAPTSYHTPNLREFPVGRLFHVITNGVRNMAPYGPQVAVEDRWAIAAYVKALQASQQTEN